MATELAQVAELQVKVSPSMGYNNLSCAANMFAFAHQADAVVVRPLGPHKLPVKEADRQTIKHIAVFSVRGGRGVVAVTTAAGLQLWDGAKEVKLAGVALDDTGGCRASTLLELGERLISAIGLGSGLVRFIEFSAEFAPTPVVGQQRTAMHKASVSCLAGSHAPPGAEGCSAALLVSGDAGGGLVLWNASLVPYVSIPSAMPTTECVSSVACAGDVYVAAAYGSGKVRLFLAQTGELRVEICAHSRWINAMAYSPARHALATVGDDSMLALWQVPTVAQPRVKLVGMKLVKNALLTGVAFNAEGTNVVTVAFDNDRILTHAVPPA